MRFSLPDMLSKFVGDIDWRVRVSVFGGVCAVLKYDMLEGGCHVWRIPATERAPAKIPIPETLKHVFFL